MAVATLNGQMAQFLPVSSYKTTSMAKEYTHGLMDVVIMVHGKQIKWMEKVNSPGQMVVSILVNIKKIKRVAMVNSSGVMARSTEDSGKMDFSTVMHLIFLNREFQDMANGLMAKEPDGF